jgi:hypothetical protein
MDAVLAILVLGAVIFFGALISAGNERQRKALDGIREQAALWAMQDLRLKREKMAQEVKVDDPVAWLNQVVAKVCGENLDLTVTEIFDNPQALVCMARDGRKVVLSPTTIVDLHRVKQDRKRKLSRIGNIHPLLDLPKNLKRVEVSMLNAGIMFDMELPLVWKCLTNNDIPNADHLTALFF